MNFILLLVILPLITAIVSLTFGRWLGQKGTQLLTITGVSISFIISLIFFVTNTLNGITYTKYVLNWISTDGPIGLWDFILDPLSVIMLLVVTSVSTLVHIYSIEYMRNDPHVGRFMSYLSLFTFFMLILVTSGNFISLFLGWEGVGLSSYLLINFWFTRLAANKAAMKAIIVNRIGDFGLSLAMFGFFYQIKSLDFPTVFVLAPYFSEENFIFMDMEYNKLTILCLLLFLGAVGKSAQIGLHTWLPDAMEGPTPVSALIHAATMVTAGVFLIIRCSPIFEYAPNSLMIITFVGAVTAFFAATTGLVQNDLKRVIAYSTCSQLGYMIFACGISNYLVSMFHLMNHAFFKALLFLSAGSVIHALNDEQDMRKMGGLMEIIPFTYSMMLIGSLSLMGFPFLTGFYSKDVILEVAFAKYTLSGSFVHWLGSISAFFTAFYSLRLLFLTFINNSNSHKNSLYHSHEPSLFMIFPLIILALGSIFVGYIFKDMLIGLGTNFWGSSIFILPEHLSMIDAEFIPYHIKLFPVILSIFGAMSAIILYSYFTYFIYKLKKNSFGKTFYSFLNKKWYFDTIFNSYIVKNVLDFGYNISFKTLDRGLIEFIGPFGLVISIKNIMKTVSQFHSGHIYHYAFVMFISLILLFGFFTITLVLNFSISSKMIFFLGSFFFFFEKDSYKKLK